MKTTLNLKNDDASFIEVISEQFNISKSNLIQLLLRFSFKKINFSNSIDQKVAYQKKNEESENWECCHVTFDIDVYNKCQSIRFLNKISVSSFVSFIIEKYMDDIINILDGNKNCDNYPNDFIIIISKQDDYQEISIFWGMPEQEKLINLTQT